MANIKLSYILLLLFTFFLAAHVIQGSRTQVMLPVKHGVSHSSPLMHLQQGSNEEAKMNRNSRRLMIGSTAPTCTYNECRGCKYKCRAEQVPVEGNDPINSAYHYKCVCHRS
ncbi:hypothetical protein CCACVL1_24447 [Corchorus capsularis]|uniref:Stomagen C-terminal domain-containing protein n=1 Tax=Corchorus capsularis TaxID=210143 RepID=A0A1R3GPK2_COCAP|nr:hypothetical protein CCACVL1_24447 [Corchorus capsularis]